MGLNSDGFSCLSARHACKCMPSDELISIESVLVAIGREIGVQNIMSASRMNKAIVVFLKEIEMVSQLVECGLTVQDVFVPVLPLSNLSKKVMLSNVPPFISDKALESILARYGKLVGQIKMIPLGLKNPELKHVMSFRRQALMILSAEFETLEVSVKLTVFGRDYTIFITTETMKCFVCGKYGHIKTGCPVVKEAQSARNGSESNSVQDSNVLENNDLVKPTTESAAVDLNAEIDASTEMREQLPQGGNIEITETDATIPDARQSGTNDPVETVEELEQSGEQDGPKVSDVLDEVQASSRNMSQNDVDLLIEKPTSQVVDSDLDSDCSDLITDELDELSSQESTVGRLKRPRCYSLEQLDDFLNATKNQRKPKIEMYFPDLKLFIDSSVIAMKKATLEELDQPKRYRLKKFVSAVRKRVKKSP